MAYDAVRLVVPPRRELLQQGAAATSPSHHLCPLRYHNPQNSPSPRVDLDQLALELNQIDGYTEAVTLAHALTLMVGLIRAQASLPHRICCRNLQRQTVKKPKGRHFQWQSSR